MLPKKTSVTAPPPPRPILANGGRSSSSSTSTSKGGVLFLSTSKKQVPQQQDALLSALGYDTLRKKQNGYDGDDDDDGAMKPSVWGTTNAVAAPMSKNTQRPLLKDDHPDHSHILPLPLPSSSLSLSLSSENRIHSVTKDNVPLPQQTETETTMTPTNDTTSPSNTTPNTTSTKTTSTDTNTSSSNTSTTNMIHDQVEYMRQLAKSRTERKRLEEESRILEQKERAAARLMALERKLGGSTSTAVTARHQQDSSIHDGIGPSTNTKEEPETSSSNDTSRFDRTRSTSPQPIMEKMKIPNYYEHRKSSTSTGPRMLFDPKSGSMVAAPLSNTSSSSLKGSSSKSSSNKSRIKKNNSIHSSSTVKPFVDKKGTKGTMSMSVSLSNAHDADLKHDGTIHSLSSGTTTRGNHNVTAERAVEAGAEEVVVVVADKHCGKTSTHGNKDRNIPRTCGVLYTRDEHGSYISVDGCDGDQGYGYHLFPGGRIRNVKAYEEYEQEHLEGTLTDNHDTNNNTTTTTTTGSKRLVHKSIMHTNSLENGSGYRPSVTPLNRSHFMRKPQSYQSVGVSDERKFSSLLKGDEKLDLLTNLDESPKLQATAAVWAPSQAVLQLTAAAKMKTQQPSSNQESIQQHDDEISGTELHAMNAMAIIDNVMNIEEDEDQEEDHSKRHFGESPSIGLGLGFDPTKNMDSVMMSPTMDGVDTNDLNISNLELSPENSSNMAVSGSTKSILGSSPWATTNASTTGHSAHPSMGSLSDWDFTSHHSKTAESKNESSASFLSFGGLGGNQNTWGSTNSRLSKGFHGIGGNS